MEIEAGGGPQSVIEQDEVHSLLFEHGDGPFDIAGELDAELRPLETPALEDGHSRVVFDHENHAPRFIGHHAIARWASPEASPPS